MHKGKYISVIIAAAGMSNRMGNKGNKQFILINNKPVLAHTIEKFEQSKYIDEIILVAKDDDIDYCRKEIVRKYKFNKVSKIVRGGEERQDSVYNGILALSENTDIVLSHDGARPFVKGENILDGIEGVLDFGACVIGVPVKDTIKVVGDNNFVSNTPKRITLWAAQTPQCFTKDIIMEGYRKAIKDGFKGTDDSSFVERLGLEVKMILGSYENIKITTPEDLIMAESILRDDSMIFDHREFVFQNR